MELDRLDRRPREPSWIVGGVQLSVRRDEINTSSPPPLAIRKCLKTGCCRRVVGSNRVVTLKTAGVDLLPHSLGI